MSNEVGLKPPIIQTVKADILLKMTDDHYSCIAGHYGWAQKLVDISSGVIDADYCLNVCVTLFKYLNKLYKVNVGDRIGQIILKK